MQQEKRIELSVLPKNLADLQQMPQAGMTDPYEAAALTVAALTRYPADKDAAIEMLNWLRGPRPLSGYDQQFLRDRFLGKTYLMNSYYEGSSPDNQYTPSLPYTIVIGENPYSRSQYREGYLTLYVKCSGADSPRPLKLRIKPSTGQWFLWEQSLLTGIRLPKENDPWS